MAWLLSGLSEKLSAGGAAVSSSSSSASLCVGGRRVLVGRLLADGGFAYVYAARDETTREPLALRKALCQDAEGLSKVRAEIVILERIPHHPHVTRFYGAEVQDCSTGRAKQAVSLFELCPGGTLLKRLEEEFASARLRCVALPGAAPCCCPCLPESEALDVLGGATAGLAHLHGLGIIHYDVKSENILLGSDRRWKFCDFGSASERTFNLENAPRKLLLEAEEFIHGRITPIYRPPECADVYLKEQIGPGVDIFALGCVLFAVLTGVHPFPIDSALANAQAKFELPPEAATAYSPELLMFVPRLLARLPRDRPQAAALLDEVAGIKGSADFQQPEEQGREKDVAAGAGAAAVEAAAPEAYVEADGPQPGEYTVTYKKDLTVNEGLARDSAKVGSLPLGTSFEVLDIADELQDGRVRARIRDPAGFITMRYGEKWLVRESKAAAAASSTASDPGDKFEHGIAAAGRLVSWGWSTTASKVGEASATLSDNRAKLSDSLARADWARESQKLKASYAKGATEVWRLSEMGMSKTAATAGVAKEKAAEKLAGLQVNQRLAEAGETAKTDILGLASSATQTAIWFQTLANRRQEDADSSSSDQEGRTLDRASEPPSSNAKMQPEGCGESSTAPTPAPLLTPTAPDCLGVSEASPANASTPPAAPPTADSQGVMHSLEAQPAEESMDEASAESSPPTAHADAVNPYDDQAHGSV